MNETFDSADEKFLPGNHPDERNENNVAIAMSSWKENLKRPSRANPKALFQMCATGALSALRVPAVKMREKTDEFRLRIW
jgi:hypothetical protein